jgi:hypothetical protein
VVWVWGGEVPGRFVIKMMERSGGAEAVWASDAAANKHRERRMVRKGWGKIKRFMTSGWGGEGLWGVMQGSSFRARMMEAAAAKRENVTAGCRGARNRLSVVIFTLPKK